MKALGMKEVALVMAAAVMLMVVLGMITLEVALIIRLVLAGR